MKAIEIKKVLKIGDLAVIIGSVIICLIWFLWGFSDNENLTATIYCDGEVVYSAPLKSLAEEEIITAKGCEIHINRDGAYFACSDCSDGLCVQRGVLKKSGDVMACVPNRVTLQISSDNSKIDSVAY